MPLRLKMRVVLRLASNPGAEEVRGYNVHYVGKDTHNVPYVYRVENLSCDN